MYVINFKQNGKNDVVNVRNLCFGCFVVVFVS